MQRQAKYIDHLENLFSDGLTPVQFCKRLNGVNTSKVNAFLSEANWLYDDNANGTTARWRVYSYARDKYLTEKSRKVTPKDKDAFDVHQPILLHKGAVWLYRRYLKGLLPMKSDWNGEHTHDKELAEGANHA
ncbi:Phage antirepressor protein KilAC domain protein [compost metagenome]